jgi:hypothetical protein
MATPKTEPKAPENKAETVAVKRTYVTTKKLTSKIFGKISVGTQYAVRISGLYRKQKLREGPHGDFISFIGDFRMLHENTVHSGSQLELIFSLESVFASACQKLVAEDGETQEGLFVAKIHKEASAANVRGYDWVFTWVRPMAPITPENDPLVSMLG